MIAVWHSHTICLPDWLQCALSLKVTKIRRRRRPESRAYFHRLSFMAATKRKLACGQGSFQEHSKGQESEFKIILYWTVLFTWLLTISLFWVTNISTRYLIVRFGPFSREFIRMFLMTNSSLTELLPAAVLYIRIRISHFQIQDDPSISKCIQPWAIDFWFFQFSMWNDRHSDSNVNFLREREREPLFGSLSFMYCEMFTQRLPLIPVPSLLAFTDDTCHRGMVKLPPLWVS